LVVILRWYSINESIQSANLMHPNTHSLTVTATFHSPDSFWSRPIPVMLGEQYHIILLHL